MTLKVYKINETDVYGKIIVVNLPIQFYFNKDGSYDGFEIDVDEATEKEKELVGELCGMFPDKVHYTIVEDEDK